MRADVGRNFLSEQLQQRGVHSGFLPLYRRRYRFISDTLITRIQQEQLNDSRQQRTRLAYLIELAGEHWPNWYLPRTPFAQSSCR